MNLPNTLPFQLKNDNFDKNIGIVTINTRDSLEWALAYDKMNYTKMNFFEIVISSELNRVFHWAGLIILLGSF